MISSDRALEISQRAHQRLARVDVEVVGGLVEDQQLRRVARGQRQQQPRLLAAGQVRHRRLGAIGVEAEAGELGALLALVRARQGAGHVVERRAGEVQLFRLVLGEIADAQLRAAPHLAAERRQAAGEQSGKRRFAVAVGAEQRDAVVHVDAQIEIFQHRHAVVADGDALQRQDRRRQLLRLREDESAWGRPPPPPRSWAGARSP